MAKEYISQYRIYYEDTDSGGIVYYANYLKFYERARTEILRENGISQTELKSEENIIFVVKNCEISYEKGAKLDDLITIKTTIEKIGSASIIMQQNMFVEDNFINSLKVKIASVDADSMRPTKLTQNIKEKLDV